MMNCQRATRLMSESKERSLQSKEILALRMHLMICSGCRQFDKQMNFIRKATRAFAKGEHDTSNPP